MTSATWVPLMFAILFTLAWLLVVFAAMRKRGSLQRLNAYWLALWSWPLLLCAEWLQLFNLPVTWVALGMVMLTPVSIYFIYSTVIGAVWESPKRQNLPFVIIGLSVVALFGAQIILHAREWKLWILNAPVGQPFEYWSLYLSAILVAFLLLYVFILIVEQVQQYQYELPMQVVDTERYQIKGVVGAAGFAVSLSFILVLLVVAAAFGWLPMASWLRWYQLGIALSLLVMLAMLTRIKTTSPSPFDHQAMAQAPKMSQARAQQILKQAQHTVITEKSYKTIGLRLVNFAKHAGLEPADICLALVATNKHHFRNFIYQYRMKYARQVFFGSDISLEQVAKRLKLNGSGAVSGTFLKYLEKRQSNF